MTDDLIAWLRATLDVIESDARSYIELHGPDGLGVDWALLALAEVEARRRILDGHPFLRGVVGGVCGTCHGDGRVEEHWDGEEETVEHVETEMPWPCPTVRLLALPLANQPGYREEWRL